jgi:hypothetical protein
MPIAAGHVAPDALNTDLLFLKIGVGVDDLLETAALPGDLVDRYLGREFPVGAVVHNPLRKQDKGVMIRSVTHEIAARITQICVLGKPRCPREIERVGGCETE